MARALALAALAAVASGQAPPVTGGIRWSSSALRAARGTDGVITNSRLDTWRDTNSNNLYSLAQATTAFQPTIVESAIYCHSAVRFAGGASLNTASDVDVLEPQDGGFTVFMLGQETGAGSGLAVSKGAAWGPNFWGIAQGINSGDTIVWVSGNKANANAAIKQTWADTNRWTVISMTVQPTGVTIPGDNTTEKQVLTARDNSAANWVIGAYSTNDKYSGVVNNTSPLRFGGNIALMDVLIYPNKALTPTERTSVFDWYDSTYFLTCPTLNSTNANNGQDGKVACTAPATRYWGECRQTCMSGWTATYGGTEHMCLGGEWSTSPLVCERTCPTMAAPANAGSCTRVLMDITAFTLQGKNVAWLDNKWFVYPRVPRAERSKFWNVNLQRIETRVPAAACGPVRPSALVIDRPLWTSNLAFTSTVTVETQVYVITGAVGLVARWLDENNHIRVWINSGTNFHRIVVVSGGVQREIANATYSLATGATYDLRLIVSGPSVRLFDITGGNNNLIVNGSTSLLRTGTYGLLSDGQANFFKYKLWSDCDSGFAVINAVPGTQITYGCAEGFTATGGSATRTCVDDGLQGAFDGSPLICAIDPPTINITSKSIAENSLEGALVGPPVGASSNARGATFTFAIASQSPGTCPGSCTFLINSCSGQITVAPGASINYEALQGAGFGYDLTIEVTANGDASRKGSSIVRVDVIDVNEPPVFAGPFITMAVNEDAAVNTFLTPLLAAQATDPDVFGGPAFNTNQYVLELDAFPSGMFGLTESGTIFVNRTGALDFETQPDLEIRIRAEDVNDNDLFSTTTVRVNVNNVNEPPLMANPQPMEVDETSAVQGSSLPMQVGARDQDTGDVLTYSISATTADDNNKDPDNAGVPAVFSINTNTGFLTWQVDRSSWLPTHVPRVVDGRLVRQVYNVYVTATDNGALSTTALVKVYLLANLTANGMPTMTGYSISTAGATALPSSLGGELLTITGEKFVKTPAYVGVRVNFTQYTAGGAPTGLWFNASGCRIVNDATITCRTPTGVGKDLRVEMVLVDGTGVVIPAMYKTPLIMSYEPPSYGRMWNATEYSTFGYPIPAQHKLRTLTGGRFYVYGSGFGRDVRLIKATFGPATSTFPVVAVQEWFTCVVVASNGTMLTLDAPSNAYGTTLWLKLDVAGQTFVPTSSTLTFGYRPPRITKLEVGVGATYTLDDIPTAGGTITIRGEDFPPYTHGPIDGRLRWPTFDVFYANAKAYPNGCSYENPAQGCFKFQYCDVNYLRWYDTMDCYLGPSFGSNYTITILTKDHALIQYIYSQPSHLSAAPPTNVFGHRKPIIRSVYGIGTRNADTAGGQQIVIEGQWLAPMVVNGVLRGTAGIDVRYGNRFWFNDTDGSNFANRYQWQASNCKVPAEPDWQGNGRIECDSGEGYGVGHAIKVSIGGQFSNELTNVISYGPPVVSGFEGPGAFDALTNGFQPVILRGRNFGRNMTVVQVTYQQAIDPDRVATLPAGVPQPIGIGRVEAANFTPINCTVFVNHTALLCYTAPGAGGNLKWKVVVDGQTSRDPFSAYGPAQVFNITVSVPVDTIGAQPATNLNPNGGEIIYLEGANFGPPPNAAAIPRQWPLLQWIRYGLPGNDPQYVTTGRYVIQSHNRILMLTSPGYGQGLSFEFMVGDQESGRTAARFSYARPTVVGIAAIGNMVTNGSTLSVAPDQYFVRVWIRDAPWADLQNRFQIRVGQTSDATITAYIPCVRDATRGGNIQSVACPMLSGVGRKRMVALWIDRPGISGSLVRADSYALFDYLEPTVQYTSADPGSDPAWNVSVNALMGPTFAPRARVITVVGQNFGIARGSVRLTVELRNKTVGQPPEAGWTAIAPATARNQPDMLFTWTHTQVVFFTTTTNAEARLRIIASDIDVADGGNGTGTQIISLSNVFDVSISKPTIRSLEGIPADGFATAGGETLTVNVPWPTFASGAADLVVTVGDAASQPAACQVLNRKADGSASSFNAGGRDFVYSRATAGAFLIQNCRDQFNNLVTDTSVCKFHCRMPPTVGGSAVPVLLTIDSQDSDVRFVYFKKPQVFTVSVVDLFGNPVPPPAPQLYSVLSAPDTVITTPTSNATLIIQGSDFGLCGTVIIGTNKTNMHVVDTCVAVPPSDRTHNRIVLPVPGGAGRLFADPDSPGSKLPLQLAVRAGDQRNVQPSGRALNFAYLPPAVTDVFPLMAPTRGGTTITVTGRNLGAATPLWASEPIVELTLDDGLEPIQCANVTRISHFRLTCDVPEGSGGNMQVIVRSVDQQGSSAAAGKLFSYARPAISRVEVETWHPDLYADWPAVWNFNRTNSNYSSPVMVSLPVNDTITGPTAGRYIVKLYGSNFGPANNGSNCARAMFNHYQGLCTGSECACIAAAKQGTADSDPNCQWSWSDKVQDVRADALGWYRCDGYEGFAGEGEIYNDNLRSVQKLLSGFVADPVAYMQSSSQYGAGYILSWDHEMVEMLMPAGSGEHILTVQARNQFPPMHKEAVFRYAAPVIESIASLSGGIQTGPAANDIVEIRGRNLGFGFPMAPVQDLPVGRSGGWNAFNVRGLSQAQADELSAVRSTPTVDGWRMLSDITEANAVSGATTTIKQWLFCVSNGAVQPSSLECAPSKNQTRYGILMHTHSRIVFRSHPGIGAQRLAYLVVHSERSIMSSTNTSFSYDRPMPMAVDPAIMRMPREDTVTLSGFNFGDEADALYYTEEEKQARVFVDGVEGEVLGRSANSTQVRAPAMSFITTRLSGLTVGRKDMEVTVAGQKGVMYANTTFVSPLYAVCFPGYFGRLGETCLECPGGALCDGFVKMDESKLNMSDVKEANKPHGYPRPIREFYNLNTSDLKTKDMHVACPAETRALYPDRPDVCIVGCLPSEACAGDNYCTEGYRSLPPMFRCGSCDIGFYRRNNECVKCPDSPWMLVIGFCLLAITFAGVGFVLNKKNVNIAFLSIAVDYAQVVSMFASSRIAWPPEVKELLHILSAFNLNIEIIAPECIKPDISYVQKWGAIMLLPISAGILFLGVFIAGYLWKRVVKGQRGRAFLLSHQDSLIAMFLILFYFFYLFVTRTLLEVFNCVPPTPPEGDKLYMLAVFEECGKPGGTQLFLMPMAIAGLLIYTAGYPLGCAYLLYTKQFEIMLDQLLRARGTGDSKMTNPLAHAIRVRFSRIYYQYKPDFYWWMLVVIMRKFLIAFTGLMFRQDGGFQMAVALLVLFAAYAMQVKFDPFMSPSDRGDVLREHERARFEGGIHTSLAESLKDAAAKDRKRTTKIDWQAPKAVLGKQILNRAGLFLFNYNTVESLLLGIAILVCLAGIMFESLVRRVDTSASIQSLRVIPTAQRSCPAFYKGYCTGLMWGVIMLIAFSIVYLIVVVTVEVHGAFQEANLARANAVKRAKMAKKLGLDNAGERGSRGGKGGRLSRSIASMAKEEDGEDGDSFSARIGVLETAVNPLFADAKGGVAASTLSPNDGAMDEQGLLNAAAIADMSEPPNQALWLVLRDTYKSLIDQSLAQREQIGQLKRQLDEGFNVKDAQEAREEEAMAAYGVSRSSGKAIASSKAPSIDAPASVANPVARTRPAASGESLSPRNQLSQYQRPGAAGGRPASAGAGRGGAKKSFQPAKSQDDDY